MKNRMAVALLTLAVGLTSAGCMVRFEVVPYDYSRLSGSSSNTVQVMKPVIEKGAGIAVQPLPGGIGNVALDGQDLGMVHLLRFDVSPNRPVYVLRKDGPEMEFYDLQKTDTALTGRCRETTYLRNTTIIKKYTATVPLENVRAVELERTHRGAVCALWILLGIAATIGFTTVTGPYRE